jgi:hypothetical protein
MSTTRAKWVSVCLPVGYPAPNLIFSIEDVKVNRSDCPSPMTCQSKRHDNKLDLRDILTHRHKMFVAERARTHWKQLARELCTDESNISQIDDADCDAKQKLYRVLDIWIETLGLANATTSKLIQALADCRLNSIKRRL